MTDGQAALTPKKSLWTRWWMIVIYVIVGLGILGNLVGDDSEGHETATSPTKTAVGETTTTSEALATTTTSAPTTTTQPPTPTTTLPIVPEGVYIVPDELPLGIYRLTRYMARLDAELEIIDNGLVSGDGLGLMVILDGDAYAEVSGEAIVYDDLGPIDPVLLGYDDGTYVVGYDIEPGRYRVSPAGGRSAYWARLDETLDIINNDLGDGQLIVIINESDFAIQITGTIEPLP